MQKSMRSYVLLFFKGLAMGAADVVPGVSGGTIAFISGIYDELIDSIKRLNPVALKLLVSHGPRAFWQGINGSFLLILFAGIATSVFTLAKGVRYTLEHHPLLIWSFFLGLIIASIFYVYRQQPHWYISQWLGLMGGAGVSLFCAYSPELSLVATTPIIFGAGMLAICAMILPGISGSFILLMIGMYPHLIEALTTFNLKFLGVFCTGALLGLMLFSQLLSWLLHHQRATTLSVLIGFLVGSIAVVWPWKIKLGHLSAEFLPGITLGSQQLMSPWSYGESIGNAQTVICLLLMVLGVVLVLGLEYLGQQDLNPSKN